MRVSRPSRSEATKLPDGLKTSTWMTVRASRATLGASAPMPCSTLRGCMSSVERDRSDRLLLTVETDSDIGGCPECGVVAVGHGRRVHQVADAPCFGVSTVLRWRKRVFRCAESACERGTFSEEHELIRPRAKLTSRAIGWPPTRASPYRKISCATAIAQLSAQS